MTVDAWLKSALADSDRRGLAALRPLLEMLARSTRLLREADFARDADFGHHPPTEETPRGGQT
jgi:hypothetical protein